MGDMSVRFTLTAEQSAEIAAGRAAPTSLQISLPQDADQRLRVKTLAGLTITPARIQGAFAGMANMVDHGTIVHASTTPESMDDMFNGCAKLTSMSAFGTEHAVSMRRMFKGCSALTSIGTINMGEVEDATDMFKGCSALTTVWITGHRCSLDFSDCTAMSAAEFNKIAQRAGTALAGAVITLPNNAAGRAANASAFTAKGYTIRYA